MKKILIFLLICPAISMASTPILTDENYSYRWFASADSGDSLSIDALGNLYVPTASFNDPAMGHIKRYGSDGNGEIWSTADGFGISTGPDGSSYLGKRAAYNNYSGIIKIGPGGDYNLLPESTDLEFTWMAVSPDGSLYANVWPTSKIYSINTITGEHTSILDAGDTFYGSMAFGPDGELYATGAKRGFDPKFYIFRVRENYLEPYVETKTFTHGLTFAPNGDFYAASAGENSVVYKYDHSKGIISEFILGLHYPSGLAYDTQREILYVREQAVGDIFAIERIPTIPEPSALHLFIAGLGFILSVARKSGANVQSAINYTP